MKRDVNRYQDKKWIGLFIVAFPLYLWLQPNPYFGLITTGVVILLAICIIKIIIMVNPYIERHLPYIFLLSAVTFELYLVHYSVIGALNEKYHGKWLSYPLVFLISVALAFVVYLSSKPYKRLIRRCTGLLLNCTPYN
jgi:peptidoglycan/LPS O-acetylase OafA/YrhL